MIFEMFGVLNSRWMPSAPEQALAARRDTGKSNGRQP